MEQNDQYSADGQVSTFIIHQPDEAVVSADAALTFLIEGNARFTSNMGIIRNTNSADREVLSSEQKPFAVVVTCSDSRVSPEIYFDQKLGDIFVIRNAGNIADSTALGSIEYAVEHLHVPLVIVVGHSKCGAVTGAFGGSDHSPENLKGILDTISGSIAGSANVDEAIHANIDAVVAAIKNNNVIKHLGTTVLGAHYDIESGQVSVKN